MALVGYARVNSVGQSLEAQLEKLKHSDKIFQEKKNGMSGNRARLKACLEAAMFSLGQVNVLHTWRIMFLCMSAAAALLLWGTATLQAQTCTVDVSTTAELKEALYNARAGQVICLTAGTYSGKFVISESGSPEQPIVLIGPADAILDAGGTTSGYVLYVNGADYWQLKGFTVRNGKKGIMLDQADYNLIDGVTVTYIGEEAIHLRKKSSHNIIQNCTVSDTGREAPGYGEAFYIGSDLAKWDRYWSDVPDADYSDHNQILDNHCGPDVRAECVDVKEGTSFGMIRGNTFDATGLANKNYADSWIDMKGNNWTVQDNTGINPNDVSTPDFTDGFQTHPKEHDTRKDLGRWGNNNTFAKNTLNVNSSGYGVMIHSGTSANVVCDDNLVSNAGAGISNIFPTDCGSAPVAQITSPENRARFATEDEIVFAGTGSDSEDGELSGASLVGSSNVDGEIGRSESFTFIEGFENALSFPGERVDTDIQGMGGDGVYAIAAWDGFLYDNREVYIEDQTVYSGNRSLKHEADREDAVSSYTGVESQISPGPGDFDPQEGDEMWARMMIFIPEGSDWRNGINGDESRAEPKIFRVFWKSDHWLTTYLQVSRGGVAEPEWYKNKYPTGIAVGIRFEIDHDNGPIYNYGASAPWSISPNNSTFTYVAPDDNNYENFIIPYGKWVSLEHYSFFSSDAKQGKSRFWKQNDRP
jgi:hypothetical protein